MSVKIKTRAMNTKNVDAIGVKKKDVAKTKQRVLWLVTLCVKDVTTVTFHCAELFALS
jgi:hypothetical protein